MSRILLTGLNHERAPVEIREALAFSDKEKLAFLQTIRANGLVLGAVLLSTCNRVELYSEVEETTSGALIGAISEAALPGHPVAAELFYVLEGKKAVAHLFRVASGLDSMVIGEPQILGQVKEAYFLARDEGVVTTPLNLLFQKTFHVAKHVRSQTGVGRGAVTISYAAFNLSRGIFADLSSRRILLLGAGEMSRILATHFREHGVKKILVANRTRERGEAFARQFGAEIVAWEDFPRAIIRSDIVVASTASQRPVILRPMMETVMKLRRWESIFLIDIAVPRNIDEGTGELDGVYLYNIDDLQQAAEKGMEERKHRAAQAEALIASELSLYARFLEHRQLSTVIGGLMEWVTTIQDSEVKEALEKLEGLNPKQEAIVRNVVRRVVHKLLHQPITAVKRLVVEEDAGQALRFFREFFPFDSADGSEEKKQ